MKDQCNYNEADRGVRRSSQKSAHHTDVVTADQLSSLLFFEKLPTRVISDLAGATDEVQLEQGEFVVRQYDEARHVHFLLEGAVAFLLRVEHVDDLLVGVLQNRGVLIGWSSFRPPYRYTASVRCEEPCRLLRLPRESLAAVMKSDPGVGHEMLGRVAKAVANRLEQVRDLLVMESEEVRTEGASY